MGDPACYRDVVLDLELLAPEKPRPLSRREYDALVDLGAFADERAELLHGVVVTMTPSKPPHAFAIQELSERLIAALAPRAKIRVQLPLALTDDSEPEPDIAVVPPGDYGGAHPTRAFLAIEVADSSLRKDRHIKAPLYASAGVPEYWLVNLVDGVVEVHRDPAEGKYRSVTRHARTVTLRIESFPDVALRIADFLR